MKNLIRFLSPSLLLALILGGCATDNKVIQSKGLSIDKSNNIIDNKSTSNIKKEALLIGISDYAPKEINDLDGIEKDTNKMKKLLESWGFKVKILYNSQSLNVIDYLKEYAKKLGPNDYFVFYYSGHGSFKPDENGDENDNEDETLVLSDGTTNKHLLDDTLYAQLNSIKAKKMIFLDSCHSGTAFRSLHVKAKSIKPEDVTGTIMPPMKSRGISIGKNSSKDIITGSNYIVFSASQDNEESLATPDGSLFTDAIYKTFTKNKYLNEPLKDIKKVLTDDIVRYAKKTGNTPHHPNITFSNSSMATKSINDFIQTKGSKNSNPMPIENSNTIKSQDDSIENILNKLLLSDRVSPMSLEYKKTVYKTGDSVEFTLDTKGEDGYLTIFYVDKDNVTILYPNPYITVSKIRGRYKFPNDFSNGKFVLEAYKNCKNCNEEKTVIYTLLSPVQITDIKHIKSKGGLFTFPRKSKESQIMSRAVRIKATSKSTTNNKPQLGKYEFIVR
jgi:hypothetical protein